MIALNEINVQEGGGLGGYGSKTNNHAVLDMDSTDKILAQNE